MASTWLSLAWKEWHEHKWKLVAMLGVLTGVTSLVIWMEVGRDRFGVAIGMLFMCSIPLGAFIGLGAAANERSRGTMPFLQALPVPMWHVAIIKLALALATIVAAIALCVASFSVWRWGFDFFGVSYTGAWREAQEGGPIIATGYWQIDVVLFCVAIVGSVFIWTAAMGVNRKDEVSAAVVSLAAMVGMWAAVILLVYLDETYRTSGAGDGWLQIIGFSAAPGGFAVALNNLRDSLPLVATMVVAAAVHAFLVTRYVRSYGNVSGAADRSPQVAVPRPNEWLGPPRRSIAAAIAWKQLRESVDIAIAGLLGIFGFCAFTYATSTNFDFEGGRIYQTYAAVAISLGFGIALVAGIGVSLHDSEPRLNTFWRSRPINPDAWFWIKFLTGLTIVLAAIYVPMWLMGGSMDRDAMLSIPALHVGMFAAAVATTCIVRHAIYAAILSLGVLTASIAATWLAWDIAKRVGLAELDTAIYSPFEKPEVVLASAAICFIGSTIVAWLAMRNDWGLKSRY
jgi:hypothetical protein